MAPLVSLELRECIIIWTYELNMSIDTIAQLSGRYVRDLFLSLCHTFAITLKRKVQTII